MTDGPVFLVEVVPCAYCGAGRREPCSDKHGNPASRAHAFRIRDAEARYVYLLNQATTEAKKATP